MHLADEISELDGLVERAQGGDRRATAQLYRRFHDRIFRQAYMLVRDADVAHDLAQEAFARALGGLADYDPQRSAFSTWLYGIVVNLSREHWRRSDRGVRLVDRLRALVQRQPGPDLEAQLGRDEQFDALEEALARLPPSQREALVLVDLQQLSPEEAGARLGISSGNVRVRAHRARRRLQGLLGGSEVNS
ncbi:MAG: RNA polymerase sigma factor [Myxococcota bacterium]